MEITHKIVDGRPHRAARMVCAGCGSHELMPTGSWPSRAEGSGREERSMARKFEQRGWIIDGKSSRCPACVETLKPPKKEIKVTSPVQIVPPPRPMGREDRRIIFEKLNEIYIDEKTGYSDDWTDKKVAENLGIPQAWVATIRDENFGPVASNAKIDEAIDRAVKVILESRKTATALLSSVADLEGKIKDIQARVRP